VASNRIEKEPEFEYEFSFICTDGSPCFCTLWDKTDLSACQRISCANLAQEQVVYNKETGVGFFVVDGFRWSFRKEPIQRSYGPWYRNARQTPEPVKKGQNADDILAAL
jgi:hypothetical protein